MTRTKRLLLLGVAMVGIASTSHGEEMKNLQECLQAAADQLVYCIDLGIYPPSMCENTYDIVDGLCHQQFAT
jgi:hypothetical protein